MMSRVAATADSEMLEKLRSDRPAPALSLSLPFLLGGFYFSPPPCDDKWWCLRQLWARHFIRFNRLKDASCLLFEMRAFDAEVGDIPTHKSKTATWLLYYLLASAATSDFQCQEFSTTFIEVGDSSWSKCWRCVGRQRVGGQWAQVHVCQSGRWEELEGWVGAWLRLCSCFLADALLCSSGSPLTLKPFLGTTPEMYAAFPLHLLRDCKNKIRLCLGSAHRSHNDPPP